MNITPQQSRIGALLVRGMSNKEIGHALGISCATVKTQLQFMFLRLGVKNRTAAAVALATRRKP